MMRIVGLTNYVAVTVQKKIDKDWEQETLSYEEFTNMMRNEHPILYGKYLNSGLDDIGQYFYHYGETEEMKRKGIAHIFS